MPWEPGPGVMLGGKYRLERSLAAGGMGSVWLARHTRLDADVAVKLMAREIGQNASSVARFEREAKACAQLSSPHVVGVHDFGVEDETPYMVMELLRGEDLGDRIDRIGRMSLAEAVGVAVPIGKALRVAHDAGLVHRDLKPRNVFIAQQGHDEVVKLVDFGIARETKTKLVDDRTASGVVMGSPYHMAPEQAQALVVDHRADLWAFGVVLYRLVTGFRPFDGDNVTSVLVTICTVPHPTPTSLAADLSPEVDAFFKKALAKDPTQRFQTARELVDAFVRLAEAPQGEVVSLPSRTPPSLDLPSSFGPTLQAPQATATPASSQALSFDARTPSQKEASASHALRAVSTGAQSVPPSRSRAGLYAIVAAAVVLGSLVAVFVVPRLASPVSTPDPSALALPDGAPPVARAAATPEVTPGPPSPSPLAPEATSPAIPTAPPSPSAAPSASAAPAAPPPRGQHRPAPPPPRPPPPSAPKIDPFTGLPVAP